MQLLVLLAASLAAAKVHRLFVGNLQLPASVHTLEFDDEKVTFVKTATVKADAAHPWIGFDKDKKNIYGASIWTPRIASYSIGENLALRQDAAINANGSCWNQTSAFVMASQNPPYNAYTGSWPGPAGCGMTISVHSNGTLKELVQSWLYRNGSAIHGMAFGRSDTLVYSADLSDDAIWTHKVGGDGNLELVGRWPMPEAGMHPRHVIAHSNGGKLYGLLEHANLVVEYALDDKTGAVVGNRSAYSLIPPVEHVENYWSAEVKLSASEKYLWATARGNSSGGYYGFISCFELDGKGAILKRLFMVPTSTTGGIANAIAPSPFSDEWAALTDYPNGYVQMWRLNTTAGTAKPVVNATIGDGGCCANAIWYD